MRLHQSKLEVSNILVVDDQAIERQVICSHLSCYFKVTQCSNGHSSIQSIESVSPDLILLSVEMPEMDGIETCYLLKQIDSHIPIIFISGVDTEDIERQCWEAGGDDFLTKPLVKSNLIERINILLLMISRVKNREQYSHLQSAKFSTNNRWYTDFLQRQCDISTMRNTPISLSIVKILNIDKWNNLLGWKATDDAITQISSLIIDSLMNSNDILTTYGSDRFLCVLPDSGPESARHFTFMLQQYITRKSSNGNLDRLPKVDCVTITQTKGIRSAERMFKKLEHTLCQKNENDMRYLTSKILNTKSNEHFISAYLNKDL